MAKTYEHPEAIPGHPGYSVTRDGRVWSERKGSIRLLRPTPDSNGYGHVALYHQGAATPCTVHRLICLVFHGEAPPGHEVRHLDGNPANNHADNLCWGTSKENHADMARHGRTQRGDRHASRLYPERRPRGERNKRAKLTEGQVREMRSLHAEGWSNVALAARFGVTDVNVSYVVNRRTWAHI